MHQISIIVDKDVKLYPAKVGRKLGTGESAEYDMGTLIFETLEVGQSTFICRLREKMVSTRLKRLSDNEFNYGNFLKKRKYTLRKEGIGFRVFRIN